MSQIDTMSQEECGRVPLDLAVRSLGPSGNRFFYLLVRWRATDVFSAVRSMRDECSKRLLCVMWRPKPLKDLYRRASLLSKLKQRTSTNDRHSSNFRTDRNKFCFAKRSGQKRYVEMERRDAIDLWQQGQQPNHKLEGVTRCA